MTLTLSLLQGSLLDHLICLSLLRTLGIFQETNVSNMMQLKFFVYFRQYLSGLNSLEDNFPTFFVCNNEDSTLFLGKSKLENEHKTYKVEDRGIASSSIQLGDLIEEHKKLQPTSKFQIGARSVYNVSDPMGANVNEDFSSVKLRFSWNNPVTLCEAPPGFANAEIHAQVSFSDDRLSSFKLHQDIQLLNGLLQGLNNQGIKWFANDEEDFDLFDSLKNLLLDVKQIGPKGLKTKAEVVTGDDSLDEVVAILERQDLDFIDLLWDVLKKVNSLAELKSAWEAIFECLKRDEIKPFVHARNSTKVAKMVKAIIREVTIDPADYLEGSLPLELLYEMGVEKLKNDYMFAILHNLLATREELEKILVEKDTILMLEKLHTIHTLLCLCQTFLSPTQACLETVVRQSIKSLSTWEKVSEKPQFTFTVPCSQLKEQISKLCPNIWQCHMNSPGDKLTIGTTFSLSIDPVSDLIDIKEAKIDEENEEEDSERKVHYYMLKAAAINRRL